jgi:hypothetical protein
MRWYHYVALFFGGAFLANTVPHYTQGISGHSFPTPFASPPGQGLSPPVVNVLWGSFNLVIGYTLCRVGGFNVRRTRDALIVGAAVILMGITLANAFGPIFAGG